MQRTVIFYGYMGERGKGGSKMLDDEVVALYWQRDQAAIGETEKSYGSYLMAIAGHDSDHPEIRNKAYA